MDSGGLDSQESACFPVLSSFDGFELHYQKFRCSMVWNTERVHNHLECKKGVFYQIQPFENSDLH